MEGDPVQFAEQLRIICSNYYPISLVRMPSSQDTVGKPVLVDVFTSLINSYPHDDTGGGVEVVSTKRPISF
ncbi:hypothetical protein TNCV_4579121 [Trichonephila clavipes]|nr:hypothetical protein TNCV_4579121 [Trichonephila clavipes]